MNGTVGPGASEGRLCLFAFHDAGMPALSGIHNVAQEIWRAMDATKEGRIVLARNAHNLKIPSARTACSDLSTCCSA